MGSRGRRRTTVDNGLSDSERNILLEEQKNIFTNFLSNCSTSGPITPSAGASA